MSKTKAAKPPSPESKRYKLVIVGDGACGKTSLLTVFKTGTFPTEYIPTIFETDVAQMNLVDDDGNKEEIELTLWDTAGQESYDKLRPLSYPATDVVLICFSIDRPESFDNVETQWAGEVRHFCRHVPVLLVGNKIDLRSNKDHQQQPPADRRHRHHHEEEEEQQPISAERGHHLALKIRADAYVECSALTKEGVEEVFQAAARAAIHRRKAGIVTSIRTNCQIL